MPSNSTEFFEFEYWIFLDLDGSCALFRIASNASLRRALTTASSAIIIKKLSINLVKTFKQNKCFLEKK